MTILIDTQREFDLLLSRRQYGRCYSYITNNTYMGDGNIPHYYHDESSTLVDLLGDLGCIACFLCSYPVRDKFSSMRVTR